MPIGTKNIPSDKIKNIKVSLLGRFLRRTNFDELPQLINILQNKMSIVGPRPSTLEQKELINLLKDNSRQSVSELAKKLGTSRATVQHAIENLERREIIQGYTIRLNPTFNQQQISAYIMISIVSQRTSEIVRKLQKVPQLDMLCTISGQYDLMTKVTEDTTQNLDIVIDQIASLEGVKQTLSHIVLSQKKNRTI